MTSPDRRRFDSENAHRCIICGLPFSSVTRPVAEIAYFGESGDCCGSCYPKWFEVFGAELNAGLTQIPEQEEQFPGEKLGE